MSPWLCLHARCHPGWRGLPRDAAKRIPLLEDEEDLAMYISWTEEMLKMILLLEDAEDKLRGPQGEGEGDIEDMTTSQTAPVPLHQYSELDNTRAGLS